MKTLNNYFRVSVTVATMVGLLACPLPHPAKAQGQTMVARAALTGPGNLPAKITEETPSSVLAQFQNVKLPRALDEEELQVVASRVSTGTGFSAGNAARFLANAQSNDAVERLEPILARFEREVEHPTFVVQPPSLGASFSGQGMVLVQFLRAFASIEKQEVVRTALEKERAQDINPALRLWLTVASGYAGDEKVADSLKASLYTEKDGSTRALILSAYARSAGERAIPLLETFLEDKTVTASGCFGPYHGLQMIARDELAHLGHRPTQKTDE